MKKGAIFYFVMIFMIVAACSPSDDHADKPLLFLPDDLEATLWAESPMFYNPTNMDVDLKGRIWVTEAVNYRDYNNNPAKFLHHQKGDRIMILEDTDNDGKADKSKIYVQDTDLVSPLGIAVIGNKVYVSCSPNLIVYTDENGDDIPDRKEILLTGFGGKDHDHSLHAVTGGPDGNLYFNTGNAGPHIVMDRAGWMLRSGSIYTGGSPYNLSNRGNMKSDDGKVWVGGLALKVDGDGKGMKVLAHNFRNAYELFVDSRGDMWQNDNDDQVVACRTSWVMEGGNAGYFGGGGSRYWQGDQRPWQNIFEAHWHQSDPGVMPAGDNTGAGSPTGIVVNETDVLGEKYRGLLLSADAGRNAIFGYQPQRHLSGYDLGKRSNFITSLAEDNTRYVWNDSANKSDESKWFRPSDVSIGSDGAIYVADWYDPVVGGHQMQDSIGHGRIYRIAPKHKKLSRPLIDLSSPEGQIEALKNPAVNVRYSAFLKLEAQGEGVIEPVKHLLNDKNEYVQSRAIWLLSKLGYRGKKEVETLLTHENELFRMVAFRALRAVSDTILPYAEKLVNDPSATVRREVLISLRDLPYAKTKSLLLKLIEGYDGKDRWYLEAIGSALNGNEENIFPAIVNLFGKENESPEQWNAKLASLAWRLHPPSAVAALKVRAASEVLGSDDRSKALTALGFINTPAAVDAMLALTKSSLKDVAEQSRYWVSFRQSNDWFSLVDWSKSNINTEQERKIVDMKVKMGKILDEHLPFDEKRSRAREMAKDSIGAQMLLGMVMEQKFPKELYPVVEEHIFNNPDQGVRIQASLHFKQPGGIRSYSISTIAKLIPQVEPGKSVFQKNCAACHQVKNAGKDIGPDLTLIQKKFTREGLLDAIINPSAGIVFGYEPWTINTKDGESYFGFLVADGAEAIVVKDLAGKQHTIAASKVSSRKKQEKSLMPSPSSLGLSEQNLADVAEYLMTLN